MEAKCNYISGTKGLDVIVIDLLQYMRTEYRAGQNRDQVLGDIMGGIKAIAKRLNVAVILLSHLNRDSEKTSSKRPTMSDLRDSGNIEAYSDVILFLLRPEAYFKTDHNGNIIYESPEDEQFMGICQGICEKNRDGSKFEFNMKCDLGTSNFYDKPIEIISDYSKKQH